jgi:hypothetical protein
MGSGPQRRADTRRCDHFIQLDVAKLNRYGCFSKGWYGHIEWMRDGHTFLHADGKLIDNSLCLWISHKTRPMAKDAPPQIIPISMEPCRLGGHRHYFQCTGKMAGTNCQKRVVRLYYDKGRFICRHCADLLYPSQLMQSYQRALHKVDKIRARLGSPRIGTIKRPKGMWQSTFERTLEHLDLERDNAEKIAEQWFFRSRGF